MPLIIPTASSTYGDSTTTEGDYLRKYVLAQFRSDADLTWVSELRARLVKEELKYSDFKVWRPRLRTEKEFWRRIEKGVGQASIVVIDPRPIEAEVLDSLGGIDLSTKASEKQIIERCATAIVSNTPIAYLPLQLAQAVPWGLYDPVGTLDTFTPDEIRTKIGGGLRQAKIFAARAHAVFDLQTGSSFADSTGHVFRSPLAPVMLAELVATVRNYDFESPETVKVLNEAADEIAAVVEIMYPTGLFSTSQPLVREVSSQAIDEIQAADIAAGWARDCLEVAEPRALGDQFERVWINGRKIKG